MKELGSLSQKIELGSLLLKNATIIRLLSWWPLIWDPTFDFSLYKENKNLLKIFTVRFFSNYHQCGDEINIHIIWTNCSESMFLKWIHISSINT
jgi:hypothetical protein